jgi:hypothetical protein
LYVFSHAAFWQRPAGGPLVTPTYNVTKTSGDKVALLGAEWQGYLRSTNSAAAYAKIVAKDWGPSKGINQNGMLILNALIYPGRNVVRIVRTEIGLDGALWGLLDALPNGPIPGPETNFIDTPHLVHRVYGSNSKWTWFELSNSPAVPLVGSPRWVRMEWLLPIDSLLPKIVKVTAFPYLNIREFPDVQSSRIASKLWGSSVTVREIRIAKGGIWGRLDNGWIALRYNDGNLTDWKI